MVINPEFFVELIVTDNSIIADSAICLRYISYGFIMYGVGMVLMQSINGSGDTKIPTLINFLCYWVFEVPVAVLLAYTFDLGPEGVYIAILIAESLLTILGYFIIKRGKWKLNVV